MKSSKPIVVLIDCGRASRRTRGFFGVFTEAGSPPFIHFG